MTATRGRGWIRAALFGSVTAELVEHLGCPLVVVPDGAAAEYVASAGHPDVCVVCAIDDGALGERVLACADHLAGCLGARLHVVRPTPPIPGGTPAAVMGAPIPRPEKVLRDERHAEKSLENAATRVQEAPGARYSVETGDAASTLADISDGAPAQLLVLADGAPWQRLAASADVPVVVVPARDAA